MFLIANRVGLAMSLSAGCWLLSTGVVAAADQPPVIEPAAAGEHVDQVATVEFVVRGSRLAEAQQTCFLNSKADFRDPANFTAVIFAAGLADFAQADIDNPAEHFRDQKIRVTGTITVRNKQHQIVVSEARQVKLVERP